MKYLTVDGKIFTNEQDAFEHERAVLALWKKEKRADKHEPEKEVKA